MKLKAFLIAFALASVLIVSVFYVAMLRDQALMERGLGDVVREEEPVVAPPNEERDTSTYLSEDIGLQFTYADTYMLREREAGTRVRPQRAIVLVEDTQENRDLLDGKVTEPREGPTSLTVDVFQNPDKLSPSAWATEDTNWNLSAKVTSPVTVGGESGVSYTWDGLYAGKSAIVTRGNYAYVFSVTWMTSEDVILADYDALLDSVIFSTPKS